ncbi:hypothetical protein BC830DRAFT_53561 [Chytriomyces sp. MP71]|nr:hypothetical protein BC830DRAFT_53561 [Chytriomyces sp. MP71]
MVRVFSEGVEPLRGTPMKCERVLLSALALLCCGASAAPGRSSGCSLASARVVARWEQCPAASRTCLCDAYAASEPILANCGSGFADADTLAILYEAGRQCAGYNNMLGAKMAALNFAPVSSSAAAVPTATASTTTAASATTASLTKTNTIVTSSVSLVGQFNYTSYSIANAGCANATAVISQVASGCGYSLQASAAPVSWGLRACLCRNLTDFLAIPDMCQAQSHSSLSSSLTDFKKLCSSLNTSQAVGSRIGWWVGWTVLFILSACT